MISRIKARIYSYVKDSDKEDQKVNVRKCNLKVT